MHRHSFALSVKAFALVLGLAGAAAAQTVPIVQISAGGYHTCALDADGDVWCWGLNFLGQLGDGTEIDRPLPVRVPGLQNVQQIAAGKYHTCAIRANNRISCWGYNLFGQLGDGTINRHPSPVVVPNLAGVAQLSLGEMHSCARLNSGTLRCWGNNQFGSLGDGTIPPDGLSVVPVTVLNLSNIAELSAGGYAS
ncbi:MAG: RCC1 domain-containing protein [Roseinatronobacter sp.]